MLYEELLAEHVNFLSCSGTCMAVMLTGANAIERLLELVGPEDPHDALRLAPHSLHARVGVDLMKNGVYASGSVNEAAVCIEAVFGYASPFADQLKVIDADYIAPSQHQSATMGTGNSVNNNNISNTGSKGNVFMDRYAKRWGKRAEHTIYDVFAYPPSSILHLPKHTANITLDHSSFSAYNNNMSVRNSLMPIKLSSLMPHPSNCPPALRLSYYLEEDAVRSFCDDDQWIGLPQTNSAMLASSTSPSTWSPGNINTKKFNNHTDSKWRQVKTTFITDATEMENKISNKFNDVKLIDMSEGVGSNNNSNSTVDKSNYIMEGSTTNNVSERSPRANVSFVPSKDKNKTWSTRPRSPFPNSATNRVNANHNLSLLATSSFTTAITTTTDTQLPRRVLLSDDELSMARVEIAKIKRELGLQAKVLHAREMDYLLREHALRRPMEEYVEESEPLTTTLAINSAQANSSLHNTSNTCKFTSGKEMFVKSTENAKNKKGENFSLTYATLRQPFGNALKLINKTLTYPSEYSNASPTRSTIVPISPMKASNKKSSKDYNSSKNSNSRKNKNHLS